MTMSKRAKDLRGSAETTLTAKRRQAGTSLVEILVVIVIFLIGILAVIQVFPRGFRLLLTSRNNSVATALGRDEIERLKARPDLLPEAVLAVRYVGNTPVVDPTLDPLALGPLGDTISGSGILTTGGTGDRNWMLASGPNVARRIVGEGQRVPSPRSVGTEFGGLMVLDHGPIDPGPDLARPNLIAYANELSRSTGAPREAKPVDLPTGAITLRTRNSAGNLVDVAGQRVTTPVSTAPFEFFAVDAPTPYASLLLPASSYDRSYRVRVSGLVGVTGNFRRVDYVSVVLIVPAVTDADAAPLVRVFLNDLLHASEALDAAENVGSTEISTIRVAPEYVRRDIAGWTPGNPFEMKVIDPILGVLLFNPAAREGVVTRPGGASEPLIAKVDYDVLDWRVLREEFRVVNDNLSFPLSLQSIKVGTQSGPDGLPNGGIAGLEGSAANATDNVVIVDLTTGFRLDESNGAVVVDKSRGRVTLNDGDLNLPGLQVRLIPYTGSPISVAPENRTFRVLYRARNEWAVQLVKGAAHYAVLHDSPPVQGQCLIGGGGGTTHLTRLYFPRSDAGRKVTIDSITYVDSGGAVRTLEGQDFLIRFGRVSETSNLPSIDLVDVDRNAARFVNVATTNIEPVRGVKGSSVAVRVLWNPEAFSLSPNANENMAKVDVWGRSWRKSMTETYLRAEETR